MHHYKNTMTGIYFIECLVSVWYIQNVIILMHTLTSCIHHNELMDINWTAFIVETYHC